MNVRGFNQLMIAMALVTLSSRVFAQNDTITLKDNSTKQGTVQEWDYRGVKVAVGGSGTTTIKADDVLGVEFAAAPKDFKEGKDDLAGGKFDEAVAKFQALIDNAKARAAIRQESHWYKAQALKGSGKNDESVAAMKAMIADGQFPSSHYLEQIHDLVPTMLAQAGKGAEAITFIEGEESRINKLPESGGLLEGLKLGRARAYLASNDLAKAKSEATALAATTGARASEAKVMLGTIALAEKNPTEAEKLFRDALKVVTRSRERAACYNGLGAVLQQRGKETSKPDLLREALLNYLRTALMFAPAPGEPTGEHENGLYNAANCFQLLGDVSSDKDVQKRNYGRAVEMYRRFVAEYPQSPLKADAQSRLSKLGG